ncbi:MurR/RpiR family transcriptional regulator [Acidisphaera sp. S103]|uniref:MurR/RpiR family transcriptional regulator n=1 Tax=Acidisphaera sp. S103 TaxID=1747223 RepID=UPI00131C98AC|nr:MurR/RpiR family transcriptional regulator [Acidisphaera sp. S103]
MRRPHTSKPTRLDDRLHTPARRLGGAGDRVVSFVRENREIVLASSAAELGARIGTSDATVVRTIQAMGFTGLADLKDAILDSLAASTPADNMRRSLADLAHSTGQALDDVLEIHAEGLEVIKSPTCRTQIAASVHALDAAERVVIFGIGPSASLAAYTATMLARGGRTTLALNATGSMLADQLLGLRKGDVLLILAYTTLYAEVKAVFAQAKSLALPTVLLTEAPDTPLAKYANLIVVVPRGRPGGVALHGATLMALEAIIFSLAAARPEAALTSLDRLAALRRTIAGGRNPGTPETRR